MVRRAFEVDEDLGLVVATMRCTGLRVGQVEPLKPEDFDVKAGTMVVRVGKSRQEKAEQRKIAVSPVLVELLREKIEDTKPGGFLFPAVPGRKSGHRDVSSMLMHELWNAAVEAGEARAEVGDPTQRRKGRPNHAFRAAFMTGLEQAGVRDKVLDFLVGHHPESVRDRSYVPPDVLELREAVGLVPELELGGPGAADARAGVVSIADERKRRGGG